MTFIQALLIGCVDYWAYSALSMGEGPKTIAKPLVCGTLVGIILGDAKTGMLMGAQISTLYIGWVSVGGAQSADPCMAGTLGTALAMVAGLDVETALVLAVPLGLIGNLRWSFPYIINSYLTHLSEKEAVKGNYKGLFFWNVIIPQLIDFCISAIPVCLGCLYGPTVVEAVVAQLPTWVTNGFNVVGGLLPALGIAVTLSIIGKKKTIPFFFIGFLLYTYLGLGNLVVAIIGACLAYLIVFVNNDKEATE